MTRPFSPQFASGGRLGMVTSGSQLFPPRCVTVGDEPFDPTNQEGPPSMGAVLTIDSALPTELIPPLSAGEPSRGTTDMRAIIEGLVRRDRHTPANERRTGERTALPVLLELRPFTSDDSESVAIETVVVGKDVSDRGIGFFHDQPIPYRRGILTFRPSDGLPLSVEVDLSWCRFTRMGWYESGGRLLRVVA